MVGARRDEIRTRKVDGITVIEFYGHLATDSANGRDLLETVNKLVEIKDHRLVIDLHYVTKADLGGMDDIVLAIKAVEAVGGEAALARAFTPIREALGGGMGEFFPPPIGPFESVAEAVEALRTTQL